MPASESPTVDTEAPNSCCRRTTPQPASGSILTSSVPAVAVSKTVACSFAVKAPRTPTESPELRRPVSFAAPRIVVMSAASTKSPSASPPGGAPIRREK